MFVKYTELTINTKLYKQHFTMINFMRFGYPQIQPMDV